MLASNQFWESTFHPHTCSDWIFSKPLGYAKNRSTAAPQYTVALAECGLAAPNASSKPGIQLANLAR
jgi:hypothetical protein